jgi:ABC-type branched-subunit amino acid transport system substrate-binding protein
MRKHVKPQPIIAAAVAVALLSAGCSGRSSSTSDPVGAASASPAAAATGDFGDLKGVCQSGTSTSSPTQGVTASEIKVGVFSDVGFTKNAEFVNAAKVFTSWCNAAGGINGRKLVATTRDSALLQVRQRMLDACREDFALVGGGAALDAMGVQDRLKCLLPDFPGQTVSAQNSNSGLQINLQASGAYAAYMGYYTWLMKEAYPDSAGAVGIIGGDSPITKPLTGMAEETVKAVGGTVTYNNLYPALGVADWSPYAQSLKSKKVKGLLFYGDFSSLSKLEQVLTGINYKLDWIDANSNAYGPAFLQLAGKSLTYQNNYADLSGISPLEKASGNPATQQVIDLFTKYAPGTQVTLPALKAFTSWLLFAKSAASCGDALTRSCVYNAARKETAWTGGGLTAPVNVANPDTPLSCFNIEKAGADGWQPADFKPNTGVYRCNAPAHKFTGNYGKPITLADVGKSMSDVK